MGCKLTEWFCRRSTIKQITTLHILWKNKTYDLKNKKYKFFFFTFNQKFDAFSSTIDLYVKFKQYWFIKSAILIKHIKENLNPAPNEVWP